MVEPRRRYKVVIADDHPIVLSGLHTLIAADPAFDILATVSDGVAALEAIRALQPELGVLDVTMPLMTGVEVLRRVQAEGLRTRLVLLTASVSHEQVAEAAAADLWGLVMKDAAADRLLDCLRAVANGQRWVGGVTAAALDPSVEPPRAGSRLDVVLTARERQLVDLVVEGLSNKMIARRLGLSDGTVKIHLHNIYRKLGVDNRTTLATLTIRETRSAAAGGARR